MKLTPRRKKFPGDRHPGSPERDYTPYPALRAFHAPQRAHLKQPMPARREDAGEQRRAA